MTHIQIHLSALLLSFSIVAAEASELTNETKLLRGFALSQCISRAYPDNPISTDAQASASGYLEFGNLPIEAYEEAVALANKALAKPYQSKHGEPLQTMKCIDFAFGPELQAVIDRYISTASPTTITH